MRTRVKICGITRPEDALAAAEAGADAIGMVFYSKAQRYVNTETAGRIIEVLPPFVTPVGIFVNADIEDIKEIAGQLGLRHIQLNGQEDEQMVAQLAGYSVLKAVVADRSKLASNMRVWKDAIARRELKQLKGFVLETPHTGEAGGSGVENDWDAVIQLQQTGLFDNGPALIAAGGLNEKNVASVVRALRPYAVDVSSGVEVTRGQKSPEKIRAFIETVGAVDRGRL